MGILNSIKKCIFGIGILVIGYYVTYAVLSLLFFLIIFVCLFISSLFGG